MPVVAYLSRDWKVVLQVLSALHIVTPILMNYVPESPRWLLATKKPAKIAEAKDILEEAATMNGIMSDEIKGRLVELTRKKTPEEEAAANPQNTQLGFLDLFRFDSSQEVVKTGLLTFWFSPGRPSCEGELL